MKRADRLLLKSLFGPLVLCETCEKGKTHEKWWDCPEARAESTLMMSPDTTWRKGLNDSD